MTATRTAPAPHDGDGAGAVTRRAQLRDACDTHGHTWTVCGAPLGSKRCRTCARWEADPLWLPWMDDDLTSERNAA